MPRPRAFDETTALSAATDAFWRQGYAATSVRELGEAMGLGPASLYNAFGDKQALFGRCLDRYLREGLCARLARMEAELPPRAAIETFLQDILARSLADPRGCLLVNSALEGGPGEVLAEWVASLEGFFLRNLRAGAAAGTLRLNCAPEDAARTLLGTVMALRVLGRAGAPEDTLRGALRGALSLLAPPLPAQETPG